MNFSKTENYSPLKKINPYYCSNKIYKLTRNTLLFVLFLGIHCCYGQDLCFTNYNSRNGLPSSQVYDMFQDKNGDMWFATDRGLAKYDGYQFKVFDVSTGLPSNTIFDFFPQKDGKIWCSTTNNSWFYFQDGTEQFKKHKFCDTLQKYSYNFLIDDFAIDENGHVFVGYENIYGYLEIDQNGNVLKTPTLGSAIRIDTRAVEMNINGYFFHYYVQAFNEEHEKDQSKVKVINSMYTKGGYKKTENINGYFVYSTDKTVYLKKDNYTPKEFDLEASILGIGRYDEKHFWVGFKDYGVRIYDMNMQEKAHYLTTNCVTDLYYDKHGGLWISTLYNGVFHAMNTKIEKVNTSQEFYVYQIAKGPKDLAIIEKTGTVYYLENNQLIQKKFANSSVVEVFYDRRSGAFEHSIFNFEANISSKTIVHMGITDVTENLKKNLAIGTSREILVQNILGSFSRYQISQKLNCLEYALSGFIYGTNSGLYYLDTLRKKEIKLSQPDFQFRITDIKLIDGYHFIGTSGNGVLRYNEATGKIDKITTDRGLTNNVVNELFAESASCVWVATNSGLNKLTFKNGKSEVIALTRQNGLPNDEITDIHKEGNILWIGTSTGLIKMRASDFTFSKRNLNLNLFWESFISNGKKLEKYALQNLPHDARNIKFEFHLAYFGGKENVKIRYKLIGQDAKWTYTDQHSIFFNYLKPGDYKLVLQVKAENGDWNYNELILDLSVRPPFYATWWFILASIGALGLLIYWFFKIRILIYNRDLVRELMRLIVRKFRPRTNSFVIWSLGKEIRINSNDVLYFKSEGNYLEIYTVQKKYMFRYKIGEVSDLVPDKLEYLQVHRSYVVRLDKISGKSIETLDVHGHVIPIGKTFKEIVRKIEV